MHSVQFKTINPPQCKSKISKQLVVCSSYCLFFILFVYTSDDKKNSKFNDRKKVFQQFSLIAFLLIYILLFRMFRTKQSFQLNWKPDFIIVDFIGQTRYMDVEDFVRSNFYDFSSIYGSWKRMNEWMYEWTAKHLARDFPLPFLLTLSVNIQKRKRNRNGQTSFPSVEVLHTQNETIAGVRCNNSENVLIHGK